MTNVSETNNNNKVSWLEQLGYSFGDVATGFLLQLVGPYLMLFYTDYANIPAVTVSTLFAVSNLVVTFANPSIGIFIDNTKPTRFGKCRPLVFWGGVVTAAFVVLSFTAPDLSISLRICYAFICYTMMNLARSLFMNAYGALSATMTQDSELRGKLSLYRMIGNSVAGLFVSFVIAYLLNLFSIAGQTISSSYTKTAVVLAIIAIILFALCSFLPQERYIGSVNPREGGEKNEKITLVDSFKVLFKNKPLLIYCGFLFFNTGIGVASGNTLSYFFKYVLHDMSAFAWINGIKSGVILIGLLVSPFILKFIDSKLLMIVSMLGQIIGPMIISFADSGMTTLVIAGIIISAFFSSASAGLMWALVANTVEYGELKFGKRTEGVNFAMANMFQTLGSTVMQLIPGIVLSIVGYDASLKVQTASSIVGIRFLNGYFPAIGFVLCAIMIFFYPLNSKRSQEISDELKKRKEGNKHA